MSSNRRLVTLSVCVAAAVSCTTTTVENFRPLPDARVELAYVSPEADFSRYRTLFVKPMGIYYPSEQGDADPADLTRIRAIFRKAFLDRLAGDYEIVAQAGPMSMEVRPSLIDLKSRPGSPEVVPVRNDVRRILRTGALTFSLEFVDPVSGRVLARVADTDIERFALSDPDQKWSETEAAAEHWAVLFREFLDDNFAH